MTKLFSIQRDDTTNTNLQALVQSVGQFKQSPIKNITVISQENNTQDASSSETDVGTAEDNNSQDSKTPDSELQGLKHNLIHNLKMTHNLRHQDSLNSSGTISRKTSTASDYTPEHTLFDSKVTQPDIGNVEAENQEFLVAEIGSSSQENSESKVEIASDPELSSGRELSNTSISTISGDCTVRRDSQPQVNEIDSDKNLSRQDTIDKYVENLPYSENSELTYAEVTKTKKESFQSDEDYVSVTSSQYTDTITSLSDVTSGHSSGSESRAHQKIELKIYLLENESKDDQSQTENKESPVGSPQKITDEPKLKVPQRKISRFLVSPVLEKLDLPKDKNYGGEISENETNQNLPEEVKGASDEAQESETILLVQDQQILIEKTVVTQESIDIQSDINKLENEAPVCRPEMVNTLEQLKISLQNITHAQLATTVAQPATPQPPVATQSKPQPKMSVCDSPAPNQLMPPGQESSQLSVDTSTNVTPIITPTMQRQITNSSTEPHLSISSSNQTLQFASQSNAVVTVNEGFVQSNQMSTGEFINQVQNVENVQQIYINQVETGQLDLPVEGSSTPVENGQKATTPEG